MRDFHSCKQKEGQTVSSYVLKMKSYIENLERLGHPVYLNLGMGKTVNELHAMLKLDEQTLNNKAHALHDLRGRRKLKPGASSLYVSNGQCAAVEAIRSFHLSLPSGLVIILNNFHYAPFITRGIILVSRLYADGYVNHFIDNSIQVSRNNMVYFSAVPRDDMFEIDFSNSYTNVSSIYALINKRTKSNLDSALLWHYRLGHISKKRIEKLQHDGLLNSTDLRDFKICPLCMSGKMARKPYTHQVKRAKDLLRLINTNVCGLFKIISRKEARYFITFTDDFSHYGYVYLLKHKHELFKTFKVFQKEVENQLGKTIKLLHSDRGGEYMSQEFLDHLKDHGIIAHCTTPYMPFFWDYALETTARILNMVPTKKVEKTPYKVWHGQAPKLSYLKVQGYEALVKQDTLTKPDKLEPRSIKCIFIGYPKETMGYSFYYPPKNKVLVARNAEFLENYLITQEASRSLEDLEIIKEEDTHPFIATSLHHEEDDLEIDEPQSDIIPILRSTRTRHASDRVCLYIDAEEHELGELGEPANYKAALLEPEVDYEETFSPVVNIRAIKILITIATYYDYEIWQMDVKAAFLNGHLSEEVYMEQPEGDIKRELKVSCYTDTRYLTDADDLKPQTGYVFLLNGGAVDRKSTKQSNFATSSTEAEYIAVYDASKESYLDNESGITKGARHFHAKVYYIREVIEFGDIKVEMVHTDDNLADPFTKTLAFPKHLEHTKNIGMLPASSLM
nr:hypothetical protein [Tanacetum cinerariifolium]